MRVFAMARPGLEPGTPRFSGTRRRAEPPTKDLRTGKFARRARGAMPSALRGLARIWDSITASKSQGARRSPTGYEPALTEDPPALPQSAGGDLRLTPAMGTRLEALRRSAPRPDPSVMPLPAPLPLCMEPALSVALLAFHEAVVNATQGAVRNLWARFVEGICDGVVEAQRPAFAYGGVPGVRTAARAGVLEEGGVDPGVHEVLRLVVALCGRAGACCANEPGGAPRVAAHRVERGKAEEGFGRDQWHNELAAEDELLAEGILGGVAVAGQSAASPRLPWRFIHMNGCSSSRTTGSARSTKSLASRSQPLHSAT